MVIVLSPTLKTADASEIIFCCPKEEVCFETYHQCH